MISFNNISIGYKKTLFNIDNLILDKGNMYVLAGKNGVGKSTLLKSICGLTKPITGELLIDNKPIHKYSNKELSHYCSFVETGFKGVPYLTAFDYVSLGRTPYLNRWGEIQQNELDIINKSLDTIGLKKFSKIHTNKLSDGERQLLSIARALCQDTPIILLDEPTAFLDYFNKKKILQLLKKITFESQKVIILSSHDLDICIEEKIPFLIISEKDKKLSLQSEYDKSKLISIGFGN
ncbi:MAG: iron ABC transporter ATP-binding protein [Crocinitomicaceae bacterium]|nr:iron ABC transporter ATP-binding protein [Crocinitomicaceae bacterium]